MCATLIGGMDRLRPEYTAVAKEKGWDLRCISKNERNFAGKVGSPDTMIIFTNMISHEAKRKAVQIARARNIPIQLVHACGVSTLRDCFTKQ